MSQQTAQNTPVHKNPYIYIIASLSILFSFGQLISPANSHIAEAFNISIAQVGYLTSVYSIPVVILSPIIGWLCDKLGRKKVLLASVLCFGLGGFLSCTASSYAMLQVLFFLRGVGTPGISIICTVLVGDQFRDKNGRAAASSVRTAITSASMAVCPLLGGWLVGVGGWAAPFWVFALTIPFLILIAVVMKSSDEIATNSAHPIQYMKEALICFKSRRAIMVVLLTCFAQFTLTGVYTVYTASIVREVLGSPALIGVMMSIQAIVAATFSGLASTLVKRFKVEHLEAVAMVFYVAGFILGAMTDSMFMCIAYNAVFGVGLGLHQPMTGMMLVEIPPDNLRGGFMSLEATLKRFVGAMGPLFFGALYTWGGYDPVYFGSAIVHALLLLAILAFLKPAGDQKRA